MGGRPDGKIATVSLRIANSAWTKSAPTVLPSLDDSIASEIEAIRVDLVELVGEKGSMTKTRVPRV